MAELKGIQDYFIVTSNVSGLIQENFDDSDFWELHGSRKHYQC
jgi:NAD-dependent SIR2 family protein deacetylase